LFNIPSYRYFIRRYGCALNFDSGTHETYHKFVVNEPYHADCHREEGLERRLALVANANILVSTLMDESRPDPIPRPPGFCLSRRHDTDTLLAYLKAIQPAEKGDAMLRSALRYRLLMGAVGEQVVWLLSLLYVCTLTLAVSCLLWFQDLRCYNVYKKLEVDFGHEKIFFVASGNYRRRGPRYDSVELNMTNSNDYQPALVATFFSKHKRMPLQDVETDESPQMFAIVQDYKVLSTSHKLMRQPHCRFADPADETSYHVVNVRAIAGHAHMVQDFTDHLGSRLFWDRVK
jgi:hypothetical protein